MPDGGKEERRGTGTTAARRGGRDGKERKKGSSPLCVFSPLWRSSMTAFQAMSSSSYARYSAAKSMSCEAAKHDEDKDGRMNERMDR